MPRFVWVWVVVLHGRVQSVTWAAVVGCPCDWWWLFCIVHPLLPVSGTGTGFSPLPSRERGTEVVLSFMFDHVQVMVL